MEKLNFWLVYAIFRVQTSSKDSLMNNEKLTDETLYQLCRTYGERARFWRQKFAGLLPEVFRRKLYEQKGFSSIFEFAKKLAGMSEEQVRLVLNLEKRFEQTPILKSLLTNGDVSINKLARVASIAKPENELFLATQVQVLSKSAVETLVRDEKNGIQNGLQESIFGEKSLPGQTLNLSTEVQQKLIELQQKGIDINNILLEFLQNREQEIADKKEEISQKISEREQEKPATRHIPVSVKRILHLEYGTKCSIPNCQKQATEIHHFSVSQSHNPNQLTPLCKEHHELAHSADLAYHEIKRRF